MSCWKFLFVSVGGSACLRDYVSREGMVTPCIEYNFWRRLG